MCIEVTEELVDAAEQDDKMAKGMLEKLALAIKYQKHLVFALLPLLDRIIVMSSLDNMTRSQFSKIKSNYAEIGQVFSNSGFKAIVRMSGDNCRSHNCIYINAANAEKLEVYEETHLLIENLQDGEFFEYLVKQYVKTMGISWPICYMPQMGGGSTMAKVYKMEINRGQHFCLAILDSDKKWPTAKNGETCRKLKDEDKGKYLGDSGCDGQFAYNCRYYVMENIRELENLIPFEVLQAIPNIRDNDILKKSFDMSYHDMKDGLLAAKITEGDYQSYLHVVFSAYPDILDNIDFCAEYRRRYHPNDKDGFEKACKHWKLVDGLGSKVMEQVTREGSSYLKNIDFKKLSPNQQKEWTNIGKIVFYWCCCFDSGIAS